MLWFVFIVIVVNSPFRDFLHIQYPQRYFLQDKR